ncbi:MAG: PadR family transcriptional regulator [Cryobacterium sp.]|nr:PadR family transcriptional regulator [Cryobacterium sp.]
MLRLFFGAQLGPDACKELVLEAREKAESTLARMETTRSELSGDPNLAQDAPYILLTISAGEHAARATIAWADEALVELSRVEAEVARPAARTPLPMPMSMP